MKTTVLVVVLLLGALALGCLPEGKERCHGKYVWDPKTLACDLKSSSTGKKDASQAAPPVENDAEASEGGETALPSGLGKDCKANSECASYKENLCTANQFQPAGYCTVGNCTEAAHPCPQGYSCCVSSDPTILPDACLQQVDFVKFSGFGACKK
jgi:hypothetical protein